MHMNRYDYQDVSILRMRPRNDVKDAMYMSCCGGPYKGRVLPIHIATSQFLAIRTSSSYNRSIRTNSSYYHYIRSSSSRYRS
jgi:hypothetical protein